MKLDVIETAVVRFRKHGTHVTLVRGNRTVSVEGYDTTTRGYATPIGTRKLIPVTRVGHGLWRQRGRP